MVNKGRVALVVAALLGGWHILWSILVATGLGQVFYNFILWAHMIHLDVVIGPFDPLAAAVLVMTTTAVGYAIGYGAAWVWNRVHENI